MCVSVGTHWSHAPPIGMYEGASWHVGGRVEGHLCRAKQDRGRSQQPRAPAHHPPIWPSLHSKAFEPPFHLYAREVYGVARGEDEGGCEERQEV